MFMAFLPKPERRPQLIAVFAVLLAAGLGFGLLA